MSVLVIPRTSMPGTRCSTSLRTASASGVIGGCALTPGCALAPGCALTGAGALAAVCAAAGIALASASTAAAVIVKLLIFMQDSGNGSLWTV